MTGFTAPGLNRWMLAAYLLAIFSAGAVSGWVVGSRTARTAARTPPRMDEFSRHYREKLISKLTLTEDQKREIDAILKRTSADLEAGHKQNLARINLIRSNRTALVSAILTAEQQAQYEELEKAYEKERRDRGTNSSWRNRPSGPDRGDRPRGERRDRDRERSGSKSPVTIPPTDTQLPR